MKIQTKASTVLERTSRYLRAGVIRETPVWYNVVGANPPNTDLSRKPKVFQAKAQIADPAESLLTKKGDFYKTRTSKSDIKQKNNSIGRIPKLEFLEDQLRDVFYHQHPWEFARPKTLIENTGNDNAKCDWSHMLQFTKPLDGESVVQRTLWILQDAKAHEKETSLFDAYDQARFEFYKLRMAEEMSSAVSKEESSMFGAIFPSSNLQWGIEKEQEVIDVWAKVAAEKTKIKDAGKNKGNASASMGAAESTETTASVWETTIVTEEEETK